MLRVCPCSGASIVHNGTRQVTGQLSSGLDFYRLSRCCPLQKKESFLIIVNTYELGKEGPMAKAVDMKVK